MKILIDLDYTLLDTDKFKDNLDVYKSMESYENLLYPDSLEFIKYASGFGIPVIFSEGEIDFQKDKLKKTGLEKIFGANIKLYPSYKKILDLPNLSSGERTVLVDDRPDILDRATELGIFTIRVKRGKFHKDSLFLKPFAEVTSLSEIVKGNLLAQL